MAKKKDLVVGFDLGGTKMLAAVMDPKYKILSRSKKKTRSEKGAKECFERICETIQDAMQQAGIDGASLAGIGVGSPGPLDPWTGVIIDTPNLGFKNYPLRANLEKVFKVPVQVDNDVNMGTYGEYHFGAAKGFRHVVGIFPGTGIGGGLILDGKLFRGATGAAGEIGHIILDINGPLCGCGQYGCLEALASRSALSKEAAALAARGQAPTVLKLAGTDLANIKSSVLADAFKAGDREIVRIVLKSAFYLGVAMATCVNILNPDAIVLGGGLVEAMPAPYVAEARKAMLKHALGPLVKKVQVVVAALKDDSVAMGAARLIREHLQERGRK